MRDVEERKRAGRPFCAVHERQVRLSGDRRKSAWKINENPGSARNAFGFPRLSGEEFFVQEHEVRFETYIYGRVPVARDIKPRILLSRIRLGSLIRPRLETRISALLVRPDRYLNTRAQLNFL